MADNKSKKQTALSPQGRARSSKESVINGLRALHNQGYELREKEIYKVDGPLVSAAYRQFGKWAKAVTAAGIPLCYSPYIKWTEEMVHREIHAMLDRGDSLRAMDVRGNNPKFYRAACKLFGGYTEAVESLGLNYSDYGRRPRWEKRKIDEELKKLALSGNPLNTNWMRNNNGALHQAASRKYGSWEKALESNGIDYRNISKRKQWVADDVIKRIEKMYKNGERLDEVYIKDHDKRLFWAGKRFFGSWKYAVRSAGIDYEKVRVDRRKKWSRKKIIDEIRAMKARGEKLNRMAVDEKNRKLTVAAVAYFGSWGKAVEAAGFKDPKVVPKKWTKRDVVFEIQKLQSEGSDLVSTIACVQYERLFHAGVTIFGSWEKAVRAAGIEYDDYRKTKRRGREK